MDEFATEIIATLLSGLIVIYPLWRIHERAGFAPATSLLIFVPFLGGVVIYLMLAFRRWPNTEDWNVIMERRVE